MAGWQGCRRPMLHQKTTRRYSSVSPCSFRWRNDCWARRRRRILQPAARPVFRRPARLIRGWAHNWLRRINHVSPQLGRSIQLVNATCGSGWTHGGSIQQSPKPSRIFEPRNCWISADTALSGLEYPGRQPPRLKPPSFRPVAWIQQEKDRVATGTWGLFFDRLIQPF